MNLFSIVVVWIVSLITADPGVELMSPGQTRLTVITEPPDAQVRILPEIEYRTPAYPQPPEYLSGGSLGWGRYEIEVSHANYRTHRRWIQLDTEDRVVRVVLQPVVMVSVLPVHVSDTLSKPREMIEIGAVIGAMAHTDSEGKAKLRLDRVVDAWERIEVQLGQASCDQWAILSPWDQHVRIPDTETKVQRIVLVKKGCRDCLRFDTVGRSAALHIVNRAPNAESGVEELATAWGVSPTDVRASIGRLTDSTDHLDRALFAMYDGNTAHALDDLRATRSELFENTQGILASREGLEAMDKLVTVDAMLGGSGTGAVHYKPHSMDAIRASYADAYRKSFNVGAGQEEWLIIKEGDPEQLRRLWAATGEVKPH